MKKFIYTITAFMCLNFCFSQNYKEKIIGTWKVEKLELLEELENTEAINEEAKKTIITFKKDGSFINKNVNTGIITGIYSISDDEKTIYQKSELDNEEGFMKIITLTEKVFIITDEESIKLYFKKL